MRYVEITATFPSAEQAQVAIERLRNSAGDASIRAVSTCAVHVTVPATAVASISRALRESGASALAEAEPSAAPGWMSHQNGHVTGTGVEPGAGDSEAGAS